MQYAMFFFTGYSSKKLYCMDTIQATKVDVKSKQRDPGDPSKDLTGGGILGDG